MANGQLVKGSGCGTREWRETFALTDTDGTTALFSVDLATGNVYSAGTFTTAGVVDGGGNASISGTLTVTGATTLSSTLALTGAATLTAGAGCGGAKNSKAILSCTSTTLGFLPPVMTGAQRDAISSPTEGLVVYNSTTHKLSVYTGSAWEAVTSA